jgi:hypothetical protein
MRQHMSRLHLNVVTTTREYPLMYLLPIQCYGMILKLTLTTIIEVVDWGKAKWHTIPKVCMQTSRNKILNEPNSGFGTLIMLRLIQLNPL